MKEGEKERRAAFARDMFRAQSTLQSAAVDELDQLGKLGWQHSLLRVAAWLRETAFRIEEGALMEVQAKARTVGLGRAKTGSTQVAIEFYVTSKGKHEGQCYTWYGSLVPGKATEITTEAMKECGWSGNIGDLDSCKRNHVRIRLEEDERGYMKVRGVYSLKKNLFSEETEFSGAEMAALQAQLDGVAAQPIREREPGDDDLPFG